LEGLQEGNKPGLETARREFREETGFEVDGKFLELGAILQANGKTV
jgi:predicted NUDIX family NTP pyrophosphohydrolase